MNTTRKGTKRRDPAKVGRGKRKKPDRRPLTPIEAAAARPSPISAGCGLGDKARLARNVQSRIVAWLVVRTLGDEWSIDLPTEGGVWNGDRVLRHLPTGCELEWRVDWDDRMRYRISPAFEHDRTSVPSITVTARKPAATIARDIERRIINAGLVDAYRDRVKRTRSHRQELINRKMRVLAVAACLGTRIDKGRLHRNEWSASQEYPAGCEWSERTTYVEACDHFNEVKLAIRTRDAELACRIAQVIAEHHNERPDA